MFAKFSCKEGKGSEMDEALRAVVAASESVDGVESYSYHRGDDGTYWFFALMSSMEAASAARRQRGHAGGDAGHDGPAGRPARHGHDHPR